MVIRQQAFLKQKIMSEEKKETKKAEKVVFKTVKSGGVEIEFTKSPTGQFKLGYNVGDKASFNKPQADILIDAGYAKKV